MTNIDAGKKSKRGFASMLPEMQKAIAAKGGAAVKPENRAFSVNNSLAVAAGRKSGKGVRNKDVSKGLPT